MGLVGAWMRRLCITLGYASGYGPVEFSGAAANIVCLLAAWTTEFVVSAATLTAYHASCTHVEVPPNYYDQSYGMYCHSASYRHNGLRVGRRAAREQACP